MEKDSFFFLPFSCILTFTMMKWLHFFACGYLEIAYSRLENEALLSFQIFLFFTFHFLVRIFKVKRRSKLPKYHQMSYCAFSRKPFSSFRIIFHRLSRRLRTTSHAPWHVHFGPGTPETVKINRSSILERNHPPIPILRFSFVFATFGFGEHMEQELPSVQKREPYSEKKRKNSYPRVKEKKKKNNAAGN